MGALSSLLAGFGQGAGEHMAQITEQKRQEQVQNTRLGAQAKLEYLKNNDNLSPEDQVRLLDSSLEDLGVKPQHRQALFDQLKSLGLHPSQQQKGQADGGETQQIPATAFPGGTAGGVGEVPQPQGQPQQAQGGGLGAVPAPPGDVGGRVREAFGPEPTPPPQGASIRDIKAYNQQLQEFYKNRDEAVRSAQVGQITQEESGKRAIATDRAKRQDALDQLRQLNEESDKRRAAGGNAPRYYMYEGPNGPTMRPDPGRFQPRPVGGTEILGRTDTSGKPIDPDTVYTAKEYPLAGGEPEYTPVGGLTKGNIIPDQNSPTGFSTPFYSKAGTLVHSIPGATPPAAFVPQTTTNTNPLGRSVQTVGPNGEAQTSFVPNTTTTTRSRAIPGQPGASVAPPVPTPGVPRSQAAPAQPNPTKPSGIPVEGRLLSFTKPLTHEELLKVNTSSAQTGLAIERAQNILKNADVLNNLFTANKIAYVIEPKTGFVHSTVAKEANLTPQEADVASDFKQMAEDVNLLRGPMGATGFRGPEAFAALQGLVGSPNGNVELLKATLGKTLKALQALQATYEGAKHPGGRGVGGPIPTGPSSSVVDKLVNKYK